MPKIGFLVFLALSLMAQTVKPKTVSPLPIVPAAGDPAIDAVREGACVVADPEAKQACWSMMRASYSYWDFAYRHRRNSFEWNLLASKVIFLVVLLLVLSGLVFAAIQFRIAAKSAFAIVPDATGTAERIPLAVQMELSASGVKVNSSVLGVIILVISMAFFYLYTRYVYPIQQVGAGTEEVTQGSGAK